MRRFAFAITMLCLFLLLLILTTSSPIKIKSPDELNSLQPNQKVIIESIVKSETAYKDYKTLTLNNKIQVVCKNCPSFLNKNISVLGILETYTGENKIKALRVKILN